MIKTRVLLADDHAVVTAGLRAMLRYCEDVEVVGEARDGREAVAQVGELRPDIVLLDIAMPGMNGIDATRLIRERYPETRVLVLSQYEDRQYIVPLLRAGASGYIPKRALASDLVAALRAVARGEGYLHPSLSTAVLEEIHGEANLLTPRELEVLRQIVKGRTSLEIAKSLSLSVKTVEWHRTNLMSKLDAHNAAELVRCALERRLLEGDG